MAAYDPVTELDERYSAPGVPATGWPTAEERLASAELYWLTTVRPDGRPHVTPLIGVWHAGAWAFCTGAEERKARNLTGNRHCVVTTGTNTLHEGLDLVLEGEAVRVTDDDTLRALADAYEAKYGSEWHFDVGDGVLTHDAGAALAYVVAPTTVFGFRKGDYSQTRWRFAGR